MSKAKIEFYGSAEILKKIEEAGGRVEDEIIKAIRKSSERPSEEMQSFIRKHKRTGRTEQSWTETIKSKDGVITAELGFSIRKGGMGALFWNVGTPRKAHPATFFVDNAIEKNIDKIIEEQNKALQEAFKDLTN